MSSLERVEKLEDQTSSPGLTPPDHCVFCYQPEKFWYQLVQFAYEKKVGHEVKKTNPCIHHKDKWLLWSTDSANFIFGSFRDIAKNKKRHFILDTMQDTPKIKKQLDTLYDKWNTHSSWIDIWSKDCKRIKDGKPQKYKYMEDIDDAAEIENQKIMEQKTIEYEKALEIIQYFK